MIDKKNYAATKWIRRQLLAITKERHDDFNLVVIRYCLERLLYRLSCSPHRDIFVVKGAMLFTLWGGGNYRATRDLDLLGHGVVDDKRLSTLFADICNTPCEEDGVTFLVNSINVSNIRADTEYRGLRITLTCEFDTINNVCLQIDVGFGDAIVPAPEEAEFPTMLNLPRPRMQIYPREVVVAEKTQAMVQLGITNSRMKDFYDVYFLCTHFPFSGDILSNAFAATFARRRTPLPVIVPLPLTHEFTTNSLKIKQWEGFLRKSRFATPGLTLGDVTAKLIEFIVPPLFAASQGLKFTQQWLPNGAWKTQT